MAVPRKRSCAVGARVAVVHGQPPERAAEISRLVSSIARWSQTLNLSQWVVGLGRTTYAEALQLQRAAARARIDGSLDRDLLLLVEHPAKPSLVLL